MGIREIIGVLFQGIPAWEKAQVSEIGIRGVSLGTTPRTEGRAEKGSLQLKKGYLWRPEGQVVHKIPEHLTLRSHKLP